MSWFFFVRQRTAYGMRISDWSSDVCSSDLLILVPGRFRSANSGSGAAGPPAAARAPATLLPFRGPGRSPPPPEPIAPGRPLQRQELVVVLDANLTQQPKGYLTKVRVPVELVASLGENAKSRDTEELLSVIAARADKKIESTHAQLATAQV